MSDIIKYKDITTIEEYKEYNRLMYKEWYKKNKERKKSTKEIIIIIEKLNRENRTSNK